MGGIDMNENIDLTKILEGCPKGIKFYSMLHGTVYFRCIDLYNDYPIIFDSFMIAGPICLTREGASLCGIGECIVFPSEDQRDWSKFERFWDKPKKERFDVSTLKPFDKVLVRVDNKSIWEPDFWGYKDDACIMCITDRIYFEPWKLCIPYNEETKHLLGTKEDCPEYYKWWKK